MNNIIILTGDNENLINKEFIKLQDDIKNYKVLKYPEIKKHPLEYCGLIKDEVISNKEENIMIITFSNHILNLFGYMIYSKMINANDIQLIIATKEKIINSYYSDEGYLKNYPINFFDYIED